MGTPITSRAPSDDVRLEPDEVHVWHVDLDRVTWTAELEHVLSADERARAEGIRLAQDQHRFRLGRAVLRVILGRYADQDPSRLEFCYGSQGKPALAGSNGDAAICFSSTRSRRLALFAVTREREIGIDLERVRPYLEWKGIAERFFSQREVAMLRGMPGRSRARAFLGIWTCKEAYVKATGTGLGVAIDQIEVAPVFGPNALVSVSGDREEAQRWSVGLFRPEPGYVGALAVREHGVQVRHRWISSGSTSSDVLN